MEKSFNTVFKPEFKKFHQFIINWTVRMNKIREYLSNPCFCDARNRTSFNLFILVTDILLQTKLTFSE